MKETHGGCGAVMLLRSQVLLFFSLYKYIQILIQMNVYYYIFFLQIILLRRQFSCSFPSPYANEYGEEDPGLRMGLQLKLREKRLNMLRQLIVSRTIGRKVTQARGVSDVVYRLNYF